jgi:uncharacterized membrane protein
MDAGVPSVVFPENINFIATAGITATIAGIVSVSAAWPGAGGYNMLEADPDNPGQFQRIPSVGVGVNFSMPRNGALSFDAAFKALYYDVYAAGAGLTWYAGR